MELLVSEIVARNLYRDYRDVNDVVQKAFTVLIRGNIYPANRGFSLVFVSVVLPFSSRFLCRGKETTKTKREQPKPRREWQYNVEKHKGKAFASRVGNIVRKT